MFLATALSTGSDLVTILFHCIIRPTEIFLTSSFDRVSVFFLNFSLVYSTVISKLVPTLYLATTGMSDFILRSDVKILWCMSRSHPVGLCHHIMKYFNNLQHKPPPPPPHPTRKFLPNWKQFVKGKVPIKWHLIHIVSELLRA